MKTALGGGLVAPANPPEQRKPLGPTAKAGAQGGSPAEQDDTPLAGCGAAGQGGRSVLLALWLLASDWQPQRTVAELRRKCRYAGLTMTASGRPIKYARRSELLALLDQESGR